MNMFKAEFGLLRDFLKFFILDQICLDFICVASLGTVLDQKHKKDVGKYYIFQLLSPVTFEAIIRILNVWPKLLTEIPSAVHCRSP